MSFYYLCLFFSLISSLKPIYIIKGLEDTQIYSRISNPSLYPECPSNTKRIVVKDDKNFNTNFISRYPNCVAKLFRVHFNTTTGRVEQLPGITTESTSVNNSTFLSDTFGHTISKIKQLGYKDNINLFSVTYNYFLHPISSFPVYDELKNKIEKIYSQTGEKSILISFNQGSSFISIFLSNYSKPEWVKKYINSIIFYSPTFAGIPSISKFLSQTFSPFISNREFKKSLMNMPGLHISLPNYVVYENYTLNNLNISQIFGFLKDIKKVDDESEKIFKSVAEKYLKSPIPEPIIPSFIINSNKTSEVVVKPIISVDDDDRYEEAVYISSTYACSHWKSSKCIKTNDFGQFIFEYLNGQSTISSRIIQKDENLVETFSNDDHLSISGVQGIYVDSGYVNAHTVNSTQFHYTAPPGKSSYPLSNAFDQSTASYYISSVVNDENYNNTIEITFNEEITLEAFLYDTAYTTSGTNRVYFGFPTLLYAYTSLGENSPYTLSGIFEGVPTYPDTRIQFVFPNYIQCDRLKLVFVEVTNQTIKDGPAKNPVIADLLFIRHFYISGESIYSNDGYLKARAIPTSEFSYTASESMPGYPISNAFDENSDTYYISNTANNETYKNFVEITFAKTEKLELFLFDQVIPKNDLDLVAQGYPTVMNIYASKGSEPYTLQMKISGPSNPSWKRVCFHFISVIECDNIKIEFVEVSPQVIVGNSANVVFAGLHFIRYIKENSYTSTNFNYSADAYLVTYSVSPTKFVYSGDEGKKGNPLSNAFDGNSVTFYISNTLANESTVNTITVDFTETISLIDIVYDLSFTTSNGARKYAGYPKYINVYTSLGNEPFSLNQIFFGIPVSPMVKIQLHFDDVVRCDKIKLEFYEITSGNLEICNLYFIPVHESNIIPISGANQTYLNSTYIDSNMVDSSKLTFTIDQPFDSYSETSIFDKNPNTYYVSNTVINLTYHIEMEISFPEQVILNAFLIDSSNSKSGQIGIFRGLPTGIKAYSSIDGSPYDLKAFFIGEPLYPHTRFQYVFPDLVRCDKLKLEFIHVTVFVPSQYLQTNQLCIGELYLMHTIIPASPTPTFSPSYSPSSSPKPSLSPTPSLTPSCSPSESFMPSQIPITDVCEHDSHCRYEGSIDNQVSVTVSTTIFSNIQSTENGGALLLKNAGLNCTNIVFSGCQAKQGQSGNTNSNESGGGGGIYIKNEIGTSNPILLNSVNFSNCKAKYGGALFIYSSSVSSPVKIINCQFTTNQATSTSYSNNLEQSGGSAIFITSRDLFISDCNFFKNIGESQLKVENVFNQTNNEKNSKILQGQPATSNVIRFCRFVIEKQAQCSLYYKTGENGVLCKLMNSVFVGNLSPGNYHINGKMLTQNSPKLVVVGCKFSTDYLWAYKRDGDNEYILIQLQKQTFDYNENDDDNDDDSNKDIYGYALFGFAAVLVVVILIVLKKQCESIRMENREGL